MIVASALREGFAEVVAIGGDGTINEAMNGFFDEIERRQTALTLSIFHFSGSNFSQTVPSWKLIGARASFSSPVTSST